MLHDTHRQTERRLMCNSARNQLVMAQALLQAVPGWHCTKSVYMDVICNVGAIQHVIQPYAS